MRSLLARYAALAASVLVLNFLLPRLLPGDPLDATADVLGGAAPLPLAARTELRASYHLDEPLSGQFTSYLTDLARADLGWSISLHQPVARAIGDRLPWTASLVFGSVLIAATGGVLLGLAAAWRDRRFARVAIGIATAIAALPEYLVGLSLLLLLGYGLAWFPLYGGRTAFGTIDPGLPALADAVWHLALPALTLVLAGIAAFALITRGAISIVLHAPFLIAARAKGLSELRVAVFHALPNALPAILALLGVRLGQVLGGALVVERVFAVPGLGLLAFQAIAARDYPLLQAVFLLSSLSILLVNGLVEAVELRRPRPTTLPVHITPRAARGLSLAPSTGAVVLLLMTTIAALAPALAPFDPRLPSGPSLLPPSGNHLFGTNDVGQDLFSVWLWAARGSLVVALLIAILANGAAWLVGFASGFGSRAASPLRGLTTLLLALPPLPLYVLLIALLGPSRAALVLVIGLLAWPTFARLVQATVSAMRDAPHVEAARALGATPLRVALVHLAPATLWLLPATLVLLVRYALFAEATLSFLGLGDPGAPSWGTTLGWAFSDPLLFVRGTWLWVILPPALSIVMVVLATGWLAGGLDNTGRAILALPSRLLGALIMGHGNSDA